MSRETNVIYEGTPSKRSAIARCLLNPFVIIGGLATSGLGFGVGLAWGYIYRNSYQTKVTDKNVSLRSGFTSSDWINIPIYEIKHVSSRASLIERLMKTGHVTITVDNGKTHTLYGIDNHDFVRDEIVHLVNDFKSTNSNVRIML